LNAPPRNTFAPRAATAAAVASICSRDSTLHGPAQIVTTSPPKLAPFGKATIVRDARASRLANR
jgi:hypothetical protein